MGSLTELGDLVGSTLRGRYELRRVLGKGGMGAVFSAFDLGLERAVAVKVMLPRLADDAESGQEMAARFRREARITAGLRHPCIVDVLDFDEDPPTGLLFLVMEQLEGKDLEKVLARERRLAPERAVRIVVQAGQAVAHAHRNGQIHRDLKPSNVMLVARAEEPDHVKVLDFGLARSESDATRLTATGQLLGTALYMAPEQIDPRRGRVTRSCDLYALGAVTYHLLSGRPPFVGASLAEVLSAHLHDEPAPLAALVPGIPAGLAAAVARALAKRPEERFPSVDAFREELEAAARRRVEPAPAAAVPEPPRGERPAGLPPRRPLPGRVERPLRREEEVLRPGSPHLVATSRGAAVAFTTERDGALLLPLGPGEGGTAPRLLVPGGPRPAALRVALLGDGTVLLATVADGPDASAVLLESVAPDGSRGTLLAERALLAGGATLRAAPEGSGVDAVAAWHRALPGQGCACTLLALGPAGTAAPLLVPGLAFPSVAACAGGLLVAGHVPGVEGRTVLTVRVEAGCAGPAKGVPGLSRPAFPVLAAGDAGPVALAAWDEGRLVLALLAPDGSVASGPTPLGAASATPRRPALAALPGGGFAACWVGPRSAPGRRPLLLQVVSTATDASPDAPLVLAEGDLGEPDLLATGDGLLAAWLEAGPLATGLRSARISFGSQA